MVSGPSEKFASGYVALIGVPNAGKSTLLNALLGEKLSAVTSKPQTTRKKFIGVLTDEKTQIIFLDTPGLHESEKQLNKFLVREAHEAISEADVVVFLFPKDEAPSPELFELYQKIKDEKKCLLVVTKNDLDFPFSPPSPSRGEARNRNPVRGEPRVRVKNPLLISVPKKQGIEALLKEIKKLLPQNPPYYPDDILTPENLRDIASELIREKAMMYLHQEIPYSLAVELIRFKELPTLTHIEANLVVEQDSQKGMVIGSSAKMIKKIGMEARTEIEKLMETKVRLELHVKVDHKWTKDPAKLAKYGYGLKKSS